MPTDSETIVPEHRFETRHEFDEEAMMSATGLDVFDRTLQTTNIWLDEIMEVRIGGLHGTYWARSCGP